MDVTVDDRDLECALTWFGTIPNHWKNPNNAYDSVAFNNLRTAALEAIRRDRAKRHIDRAVSQPNALRAEDV